MPFIHGFWILPENQCTFRFPQPDQATSARRQCVLAQDHPGQHVPDKPGPDHPVVLAEPDN